MKPAPPDAAPPLTPGNPGKPGAACPLPSPCRLADALATARCLGVDRLDAQLLLAELLGRPRSWVLAHDDEVLSPGQAARLHDWLQRRAAGEPLAYLLGRREFHGLMLAVSPAVLDPRPDTETLVDWAIDWARDWARAWGSEQACEWSSEWVEDRAGGPAPAEAASPHPQTPAALRVLDLGTGSGAIALALAQALPGARVSAVERSAPALAQARANGQALGLDVEWLEGAWWAPVAGRQFDLVVSNPPYIAEHDPHLDALRHEPRQALVAGPDGLDDLRQIIAGAPAHLAPGGVLLLEHGWTQAPEVQALLARAGLTPLPARADLAGHLRCSGGLWNPSRVSPTDPLNRVV